MQGTLQRSAALVLVLASTLLSGCAVVFADLNPFKSATQDELEEYVVDGDGKDKILLLDVSRVITAEETEGALGLTRREGTVTRVVQELRQAAEDDSVRAVILRINSPGGTVTASDIIHHEIRRFAQERNVPVIAQLMDVGASGGYYVALAADVIVAHPTSVTGSIGVLMFGLNLQGLLEKVGVTDQTLKAGRHKDIGSPWREMTAEEREILQSVLDDMRERFVGLVRERRPQIPEERLATVTDGRVVTADQALAAGLVDRIGYLHDTFDLARSLAGVSEARIILYRRSGESSENIYSRASVPQVNLINVDLGSLTLSGPRFMYLWLPGRFE